MLQITAINIIEGLNAFQLTEGTRRSSKPKIKLMSAVNHNVG